jgi:hypothetical protein
LAPMDVWVPSTDRGATRSGRTVAGEALVIRAVGAAEMGIGDDGRPPSQRHMTKQVERD